MPNLLLVLTEQHDADSAIALLPKGSVFASMGLSESEYVRLTNAEVVRCILTPMLAEAKRLHAKMRAGHVA